ncbi:putative polynucleotide adenylyltransferase [Lupinus albus]|uniref:Putative polynucleotide adenylyltransferase n=1 Tax=Lupinus albus TaxID=3870 RepID=A0A6A4PW97_LUPAL|nr:putative polynucleotide adenylyltransferase [Lupinus albus]
MFSRVVFTFGSVPLKTYLPDGDIDLTAFSKNQNVKDNWAHQVRDMLESEEKNGNAEFHVKEVQYIQAEVKIIKCLVDNIVVDISFNQLGGLCTLCFLEEVDNLISQDHLFKRSIILIKAWCYYESRLLGAHHGLISTYALETLVLYIFHVFNNSFTGPLEVLYRFLEFFSKFDWDNFCVSLWGPVPISSLPDVTAESPRKDGGELLLSKIFLEACSSVYAVFPGGQENQGHPFVSKHFNVIDPLRVNNNLGRSVSKGNFYRIRSAFALGAKRLARLLHCPEEESVFEVNQFFMNTWKRHVIGQQPDVPSNDLSLLRLSSHDEIQMSQNLRNNKHKIDRASNREFHAEGGRSLSQHSNLSSENSFKSSDVSTVIHTQNQKSHGNQHSSRAFNRVRRETNSNHGAHVDKGQRNVKADNSLSDVHGRFLFARTRSSPDLTDSYAEVSSQGRRTRAPESIRGQNSFAKSEISLRKYLEPSKATNYSVRIEDSSSSYNSSHQVLDSPTKSNSVSYSYHDESGIGAMGEDIASVTSTVEMQMMHQEEQDLLNMMASPTDQGFSGHAHIPINYAAGHLPFPPSMLASMGYAHRNMGNIPFIEAPWGANMHFPPGLVPSHFTPYFPGMGLTSNPQDIIETGNVNFSPVEMNSEVDNDVCHEQERSSASRVEVDNGDFEMHADDKQQSTSNSYNFAPPSRVGSSTSSARIQQKFSKENQGSSREENIGNFHYQDGRRNEVYFDDRIANSQLPSPSPSSSLRSKTSSESSWDGSSAKSSKSTREKRGKKNAPSAQSALHGKGKNVSEISSKRVDDENRVLTPVSAVESDISERNTRAPAVSSMLAPRHQLPAYEVAQTSGSDSPLPVAPMILGPGSRQRAVDNSGAAPFTFYPTGPPVPFVTMLPLYNFPSESSDTSTSNFSLEGGDNNDFGHNVDSYEGSVQPEVSSLSNSMPRTIVELSEHKSDILNSDFVSHWHNLQYGRFCQNTCHPPSMVYPSPVTVPPIYLQSHYPWDVSL